MKTRIATAFFLCALLPACTASPPAASRSDWTKAADGSYTHRPSGAVCAVEVEGFALQGLQMPAIQGSLLPIALPELALFKAQRQKAYMRYRIDIYESATGRFIRSTPWHEGSAYFNQYIVLFFISFRSTDLPQAP